MDRFPDAAEPLPVEETVTPLPMDLDLLRPEDIFITPADGGPEQAIEPPMKKPKRVASQKQKAHLAKAREKAAAARKAKAELSRADPVAEAAVVHRAPDKDDFTEWRKHHSRHQSEADAERKAAEALAQKEAEKMLAMEEVIERRVREKLMAEASQKKAPDILQPRPPAVVADPWGRYF